MKRVTHRGRASVHNSVRGFTAIWWRKRGFWYILRWKASVPSRVCLRVSAGVCGHGPAVVADGRTASPGLRG